MCANGCVTKDSLTTDGTERANCGLVGGETHLDMLIEFIQGYVRF